MSEKRFKVNDDYLNNIESIIDNKTGIEHDYLEIEELLNELAEENEQLKQVAKENKKLKKEIASENSILWNEILILRKQGALPSVTFENYLNDLKNKKKLKGILHG